jgi:hypothetical protein
MKPFILLACACAAMVFSGCYSSVAVVDRPGYYRTGYHRSGYYTTSRPYYYGRSSRNYYGRSSYGRSYYRDGYYGRGGYYGTRTSYGYPRRSATVVFR